MASFSTPLSLQNLVTIKLTKDNYLLWRAQILLYLRGQQLIGYVDGTIPCPPPILHITSKEDEKIQTAPNPEYSHWYKQDQVILGALMSSLSESVITHMVGLETSKAVWNALERMFSNHARARVEKSGVPLVAQEKFPEPREVEKLVINPVKKEVGLAFKGNQKMVVEALEAMNEKEALEMKAALESKGESEFNVCTLGKNVTIKKNMVAISKEIKKEHQRVFTPSVIGPSFVIGRKIFCLFEHSHTRPSKAGDEQLNVFLFQPLVAPIKCTVFPLVQQQHYEEVAKVISQSLTTAGNSHKIEITGTSIGKRYARTDELGHGVPFASIVDSTSSVTIRERDSKDQVRVSVEEAASAVKEVTDGRRQWTDVGLLSPIIPLDPSRQMSEVGS